MQCLSEFIHKGWPVNKKQVPDQIQQYYTYREELVLGNGVIFKGTQIIIPREIRD